MEIWENTKKNTFHAVEDSSYLDANEMVIDDAGNDSTFSQFAYEEEDEEGIHWKINGAYVYENNMTTEQADQLLDSIINK